MVSLLVRCIDNSNKPERIPDENWPELDKTYTVQFFYQDILTGEIAVSLKELKPGEGFDGYLGRRFTYPYKVIFELIKNFCI
jgi:hypothetical protein